MSDRRKLTSIRLSQKSLMDARRRADEDLQLAARQDVELLLSCFNPLTQVGNRDFLEAIEGLVLLWREEASE